MGSRGPAGPPGKNGDDVSDLLINDHTQEKIQLYSNLTFKS